MEGQINLRDAVRRTITFREERTGKDYKLNDQPAVLFVRARGWHLEERHILVDGEPMSGSIFDFAFYFFHNAKELLTRGSGPYFYLPKIESHLEARLWNEIFVAAEQRLGVPVGSIRATVLIETILAAFEMDEILYELRAMGLHLFIHQEACGRYIDHLARPLAGNHDHAFHAQLLETVHQDLPQTRGERHGWNERAHPDQE